MLRLCGYSPICQTRPSSPRRRTAWLSLSNNAPFRGVQIFHNHDAFAERARETPSFHNNCCVVETFAACLGMPMVKVS